MQRSTTASLSPWQTNKGLDTAQCDLPVLPLARAPSSTLGPRINWLSRFWTSMSHESSLPVQPPSQQMEVASLWATTWNVGGVGSQEVVQGLTRSCGSHREGSSALACWVPVGFDVYVSLVTFLAHAPVALLHIISWLRRVGKGQQWHSRDKRRAVGGRFRKQ